MAYRHVPSDERGNLDPKSKRSIFLGYSENRKGYRLYDINKKRIVHSRDVVFDELTCGLQKETESISDEFRHVRIDMEELNHTDEDDDTSLKSPEATASQMLEWSIIVSLQTMHQH